MSGIAQQFPQRNSSFTDASGDISGVWYLTLLTLWKKTGGGTSTSGLLLLSGGMMTGALILSGNPTVPLQAATKAYVDASAGALPTALLPLPVGIAATGSEAKYAHGDHIHGTVGQHGYIYLAWQGGAIVTAVTTIAGPPSLIPYTITSLDAVSAVGSFTLTVTINDVPVVGLNGITITAAQTNFPATSGAVAIGGVVKFITSAPAANPTGVALTLNTTRT